MENSEGGRVSTVLEGKDRVFHYGVSAEGLASTASVKSFFVCRGGGNALRVVGSANSKMPTQIEHRGGGRTAITSVQ